MTLGEVLHSLLEYRDETQKELAERLSIAQSTIGNYFQDTREPDFSTLKVLAKYFDVSLDYLLDHRTKQTESYSHAEIELLHIYQRLTPEQQEIFLKQGKLFVAQNLRKEKMLDSRVAFKPPQYEQQK